MNQAPDIDSIVQQIRDLTTKATDLARRARSRDMDAMVQVPSVLKSVQDCATVLNSLYPEMSRAVAALGPARGALNRVLKHAKRTGIRA